MRYRLAGFASVLALIALPGLSAAQQPGEWLVAPYLWATDVGWDVSARGDGGVAFNDLVDKIDGAGLIRIEYARNKIGFTFDYIGMGLSDSRRFSTPGPAPVDITVRANVDMTVFESGAFYRPSATDNGIDIIGGIRYTNVDSYLILTPGNTQPQRFDSGDSFTDIYLGARYLHRINEAWDVLVRGDYGFVGSDGALNLAAGVGWRSRGGFGMALVYRHLAFEFDERVDGEPVTSEFDFTGPALGFLFRF
ncbi:MAG: hypothetical protein QNI96_13400 [Woeseiaceae bacterium]|nr:hypothetical protein [Woeseiaceae bacterium]